VGEDGHQVVMKMTKAKEDATTPIKRFSWGCPYLASPICMYVCIYLSVCFILLNPRSSSITILYHGYFSWLDYLHPYRLR
jgi:hypothetical protein